MDAVRVENVCKKFRIRDGQSGFFGQVRNFISPKFRDVNAVQNLSFNIKQGERVAFLGPNGAGKSTTLKMLVGILYPTEGRIEILGKVPWKQRKSLAYKIGNVFGNRSQLWYHLSVKDSFDLFARIYDLEPKTHRHRLKDLVQAFEIQPLLPKGVRQLSLGERMKCELVASLLHRPEILFLDEPTIGLDVTAKLTLRKLIFERSEKEGMTLVLTSHDAGDIGSICDRLLIIHDGTLRLDLPRPDLKSPFTDSSVQEIYRSMSHQCGVV